MIGQKDRDRICIRQILIILTIFFWRHNLKKILNFGCGPSGLHNDYYLILMQLNQLQIMCELDRKDQI